MRQSELITAGAIAAVILVGACGKDNPASPSENATVSSGAAVEAVTGSVTVPQAVSPAANATIRNADQPVTLVVTNAVAHQLRR